MWKYTKWNKTTKWIITAVIVIIAVIGVLTDDSQEKDKPTIQQTENEQESKKESKPIEERKPKKIEKTKESVPKEVKQDVIQEDDEPDVKTIKQHLMNQLTFAHIDYVDYSPSERIAIVDLTINDKNTDKNDRRNAKEATAQTVYALKETGLNINSADVHIIFVDKDNSKSELLSTKWDKEIIDAIHKKDVDSMPNNLELYAEDYWEKADKLK